METLTKVNGRIFDGFSFNGLEMAPGTIDMVDSYTSMGIFLANLLWSLSIAGLVEFGVKGEVEAGNVSCGSVFQGMEAKGVMPNAIIVSNQPNLAVVPSKADCGLPKLFVSLVEEEVLSDMGLGAKERISNCSPLITIVPPGLALSGEVHNGTEVMGLDSPLDISNWVKHRIPSFGKLVGLPVSRHEKLCIAYLQRLEKEMEDANPLRRKATVNQIVATSTCKGKRELRNLIS